MAVLGVQYPGDPGIQQLQEPSSPRIWLSWGARQPQVCDSPGVQLSGCSSCPGGLASLCVRQSQVSNSPWTSLLGAMQGPVVDKWCLQ